MASDDTRRDQLVSLLDSQTEGGKLSWAATDDPTAFVAGLKNASVVLQSVKKDGRPPYRLSVADATGSVVEVWETRDPNLVVFESVFRSHPGHRPAAATVPQWEVDVAQLFRKVQRRVAGVDKIIDGVLDELRGLKDDDIPF